MNWTSTDIPNQDGKIALIMGANSGIGYEIALALYLKEAHFIPCCCELTDREFEQELFHTGIRNQKALPAIITRDISRVFC